MVYEEEQQLRRQLLDIIQSYPVQTIYDLIIIYHDLYGEMKDPDTVRQVLGVNELWQLLK